MDDTMAAGQGEESRRGGAETQAAAISAPPEAGERTRDERMPGHWRYELRRWLATLNPGRTRREYEKAVSYFFLTPGVPDELSTLTFDLLLAYRGALALRAGPAEREGAHVAPTPLSSAVPLDTPLRHALPGSAEFTADIKDEDDGGAGEEVPKSMHPLAPATVNIRLTALRQFLVHCSMIGLLAELTPDRIRMALKRLQIDRRRPYQILAESEWVEFLAAAALPATLFPSSSGQEASERPAAQKAEEIERRSPWGTPRAARQQDTSKGDSEGVAEAAIGTIGKASDDPGAGLVRSRSGLTGARTAQRDHALIALALVTGLRAIEISLLDLSDLTREVRDGQEEWWLVLPDAKTKGQHGGRTLPLAAALVDTLRSYIHSTGRKLDNASDRATPLFLSCRRTSGARQRAPAHLRLTAGHIGRIVDRVETQWIRSRDDSSGETRAISPHALRHSTAMALLEGNGDGTRPPASVEHVRGWLGHFDIRTTQGYLAHLDARHHRRALKIMPPGEPLFGSTDHTATGQGESESR